jgi:DNA-binding beta-propeller fold protein YncE
MLLAARRTHVHAAAPRDVRVGGDSVRSVEQARTPSRLCTPRRLGVVRRRALALTATGVGLLALSAGVAQAAAPKLIQVGQFASVTPTPVGVAVDQSSGDVYVAGLLSESGTPDEKFDAAGEPISPSPFGANLGAGAAVNPVNGDLDVLNIFGSLETYEPSSGLEAQPPFSVNVSGAIEERILPIATDSAGDVYLAVPSENEVLEYSPTGTQLKTFTGSAEKPLKKPRGVAVDSAGDLWVADTGNNRIVELSSTNVPLREFASEGPQVLALDGHGDVLAIVKNSADSCGSVEPPCSHLVDYSATGAVLADVGAGSFESSNGTARGYPPMVAVNEGSGQVYVTDSGTEKVWVFGPPAAPVLGRELVAEVGSSEVKLGALINPGGIATSYRFEYGITAAYGETVPLPEGSAGEGVTARTVWAAADGLASGATYHYRVVATNALGEVVGPDQTFTTGSAEQASCPNEAFRGGFSASLPDCRAYELVTPAVKSSVEFDRGLSAHAGIPAAGGDALTLETHEPFPGAPSGGIFYIATRGAGGWGVEDIIPSESYTGALCTTHNSTVPAYSNELSKAVISFGSQTRGSTGEEGNKEACDAEGLQVVPGEAVGYQNLLLRENGTGVYRLINPVPAGVTPADAYFQGASADLSHVFFSETSPLTPGASYGVENLYEWDEGTLRLVSVGGSLPEAHFETHVVSTDGSHVVFTAGGALYVRIDGERTIEVDESQKGSGASGGGSFQAATADGSKVFFLDESRLTEDSTAQPGEPDLYECVLPEGASKCELHDLTVLTGSEHADVLHVAGIGAHDSSYVYFSAKGVLAANKREYTNSKGQPVVEGAENGQDNLYVWNGHTTLYIATLGESEYFDIQSSPEGAWFAFSTVKSLTGYDNTPPKAGPVAEIFLYSTSSGQLVCASCNPSGEPPIPGAGASLSPSSPAGPRYLTEGGRVFFETSEPLVPSDTNGQADVYEYEEGHQRLISTGTSPTESIFIGTDESGDNAFFDTDQQLVPQDTQEAMQAVYDARVDGGIAPPPVPPPCTTADACRAPASVQPSIFGAPASATFSGPGDLAPAPTVAPQAKSVLKSVKCKKGFVKRKVKKRTLCVRSTARKVRKSAHTKKRGH